MSESLVIWILLFGMLVIGVPIFVALGASTMFVLFFSEIPLRIIPLDLYKISDMFPLLAVPAFIFAGSLMEKGDMAGRIVEFADMLVGRIRGGLGLVTIMGCIFFAAMIGSGPATVAAMGSLMIPSMLKKGYSMDYAVGVSSVGGTLGILIPPSNPMILYGVIANVSITGLFMAGFVPGFIVGGALILTAYIQARLAGYCGSDRRYTSAEVLKCLARNFWSLLTPFVILGGIYLGVFTPVEASCVAVMYALFIGIFVNKELDWPKIRESIDMTVVATSIMVIVVGVSVLFGRVLTLYQVPQVLTEKLLNFTSDPFAVILLIIGFLFFLGMFIDTLSTIVILAPILVPVVTKYGIDPIFFGILWVMCNEVALISPPLSPNLFIAMNLTGISLERAAKAILPYTMALIIVIFLIARYGQSLVLFLPNLLTK